MRTPVHPLPTPAPARRAGASPPSLTARRVATSGALLTLVAVLVLAPEALAVIGAAGVAALLVVARHRLLAGVRHRPMATTRAPNPRRFRNGRAR